MKTCFPDLGETLEIFPTDCSARLLEFGWLTSPQVQHCEVLCLLPSSETQGGTVEL